MQVATEDAEDSKSKGLSRGAVFGITMVVVVVALVGFLQRQHRRPQTDNPASLKTGNLRLFHLNEKNHKPEKTSGKPVEIHVFPNALAKSCVSSKERFQEVWGDVSKHPEHYESDTLCVNNNLVGHLAHADSGKNASWGYEGSPVWLMTNYDLEKALLLKKTYGTCASFETKNKLILAIMQMIGYGGSGKAALQRHAADKWFLLVGDRLQFWTAWHDLPEKHRETWQLWQPSFTPTIEGMVEYYGRLGYYVPFLVQRELVLAYAGMTSLPKAQQNPISVYAKLASMPYDSMAEKSPKHRDWGNYSAFFKALEGKFGDSCIGEGYKQLTGKNMTALHLRMMFEICSGASPMWSSFGLGFSPWPSPFVCMTSNYDPIENFGGAEAQMAVRSKTGSDMWSNLGRTAIEIPYDAEAPTNWVDPANGKVSGFCWDDNKHHRLVDIADPSHKRIFC